MSPDERTAKLRELLPQIAAHLTAGGTVQPPEFLRELYELLPRALDDSERFKRERDHYQANRGELMEMAQKQCADEVEQLKNARVPTEVRCPVCNWLHVDQDEWAYEIAHRKHLCHNCQHVWQPYKVATIGTDFHVACREKHDRLEADIAWMRSAWGEAEGEVAKLRERRDKLLDLVAKLSQTVPLEAEVADALNQRGVLLAEIGTLRSQLAEYEPLFKVALDDRQFLDDLLDGLYKYLPRHTPRTVRGLVAAVAALTGAQEQP